MNNPIQHTTTTTPPTTRPPYTVLPILSPNPIVILIRITAPLPSKLLPSLHTNPTIPPTTYPTTPVHPRHPHHNHPHLSVPSSLPPSTPLPYTPSLPFNHYWRGFPVAVTTTHTPPLTTHVTATTRTTTHTHQRNEQSNTAVTPIPDASLHAPSTQRLDDHRTRTQHTTAHRTTACQHQLHNTHECNSHDQSPRNPHAVHPQHRSLQHAHPTPTRYNPPPRNTHGAMVQPPQYHDHTGRIPPRTHTITDRPHTRHPSEHRCRAHHRPRSPPTTRNMN